MHRRPALLPAVLGDACAVPAGMPQSSALLTQDCTIQQHECTRSSSRLASSPVRSAGMRALTGIGDLPSCFPRWLTPALNMLEVRDHTSLCSYTA